MELYGLAAIVGVLLVVLFAAVIHMINWLFFRSASFRLKDGAVTAQLWVVRAGKNAR